jgi:ATP-dependent RNA helicase DDX56/DBP9
VNCQEFNRGVFDYLIATDAVIDKGEESDSDSEEDTIAHEEEENDDDDEEEDEDVDEEEEEEDEDVDDEEEEEDEDVDDEEEDDVEEEEEEEDDVEEEEEEEDEDVVEEELPQRSTKRSAQKKKEKPRPAATEKDGYGVSRGIDFKGVAFVVNFDFPASASAYTHRIGRTARGGASGTALSFACAAPLAAAAFDMKSASPDTSDRDEHVLRAVQSQQPRTGHFHADGGRSALSSLGDSMGPVTDEADEDESNMQPAPLQFNMKELDNFRYRVEDTLRFVTAFCRCY